MSIFDYSVPTVEGGEVSLREQFASSGKKAFLIVNVASACGLTASNYKGLVEVYERLAPKGLEIIAVPCNDFGRQEPGTNEECSSFAKGKRFKGYVTGKLHCEAGDKTHPLYSFLKDSLPGDFCGIMGKRVAWNFTKFLVDAQGVPIARYSPLASPESIEPHITALLDAAK